MKEEEEKKNKNKKRKGKEKKKTKTKTKTKEEKENKKKKKKKSLSSHISSLSLVSLSAFFILNFLFLKNSLLGFGEVVKLGLGING